MIDSIDASRRVGLRRALIGLAIPMASEGTAALLCRTGFGSLEQIADAGHDALVAVKDVGPKVAASPPSTSLGCGPSLNGTMVSAPMVRDRVAIANVLPQQVRRTAAVGPVGQDGAVAMDQETVERLRRALRRIDVDAQYYALTLTADSNGKIIWSYQSGWVGEGSKAMRERRAPSFVDPHKMWAAWTAIRQDSIVVSDDETLGIFLRVGGNALVEVSIAQRWMPDLLEPFECVPGPLLGGVRQLSAVPAANLRRAPSMKVRMDVLRRDDFRCRVCGRRAADHVDIELHVHHIRPYGKGGLTEPDNLITLCHTCHTGLDPHLELRLLGLLPGGVPINVVDVNREHDAHEEGVRLYRQVATQASRTTPDARRKSRSADRAAHVNDES